MQFSGSAGEKNNSESEKQLNVSKRLDLSFIKLGDNYVNLNKYEYAMECYREALKINPYNSMAFNRLILLPPHLIGSLSNKGREKIEYNSETLQTLALYDAFRQTFIGGYIVLSNLVEKLGKHVLFKLLNIVQNLNQSYFDKYSSNLRDYGIISFEKKSYVWMLNSYESIQDLPSKSFPVFIMMGRSEYQSFKKLIKTNN